METLKNIILGICSVTLIDGVLTGFLKNDGIVKYIKYISGLLLLLCIIYPLNTGFTDINLPSELSTQKNFDTGPFEYKQKKIIAAELSRILNEDIMEKYNIETQNIIIKVIKAKSGYEIENCCIYIFQKDKALRGEIERNLTTTYKMRVEVLEGER